MNRYFDRKSAARVRSRERGRRKLWAAVWTAAAVALIMAAAAASWHFRLHTVRSVMAHGRGGHPDALRSHMAPCLGRPLWDSGAARLAAEYRRTHPEVEWIKTVVLPWGAVSAEIRLRRPVARVDQGGLAIDAQGTVFGAAAGEADGLPVLKLAGSSEAGRRRAITALLTSGGNQASWTIDCSDEDDIRLMIPGPAVVRLGNGGFPEKWYKLREILRDPGESFFPCTIDLRFHNQAVVRRQA